MGFWAEFFSDFRFGPSSYDHTFELLITFCLLPFIVAPLLWYLMRFIIRQFVKSGNTQLPVSAKKAAFTMIAWLAILNILLYGVGQLGNALLVDIGAYIAIPAALSFFSYDLQWNIIGRCTLSRGLSNIVLLELLLIIAPIALVLLIKFWIITILVFLAVPIYFSIVFKFLKFRCQTNTVLHDNGESLF